MFLRANVPLNYNINRSRFTEIFIENLFFLLRFARTFRRKRTALEAGTMYAVRKRGTGYTFPAMRTSSCLS